MKKEIIKCDLCGREIETKHWFYYHVEKEFCGPGELYTQGPVQLDICRYCLKNFIEPLGKWPKEKPPEDAVEAMIELESRVEVAPVGGGVDPL